MHRLVLIKNQNLTTIPLKWSPTSQVFLEKIAFITSTMYSCILYWKASLNEISNFHCMFAESNSIFIFRRNMIQSLVLLFFVIYRWWRRNFIVFNFYSFPFNKIVKFIEYFSHSRMYVSRSKKAMFFFNRFFTSLVALNHCSSPVLKVSILNGIEANEWVKHMWMSDVKHNGECLPHMCMMIIIFSSHKCEAESEQVMIKLHLFFSLDPIYYTQ